MKHILASVMIFLGGANLPATGQSFSDGVNAYDAGNYIAAYENFKPLAEQGNASAQYNLGLTYGRGLGVPLSNVKAHMWANIAAANGGNASLRDIMAEIMTSAQIAEAQRLARICMASDYQDCD